MRPSPDQLGGDWTDAQREELLDWVLSNPGGRRRVATWVVRIGGAAAVLLVLVLVSRWPVETGPIHASPVASLPVESPSAPAPDLVCRGLDDRERNDVGVMNQTYHGVDPEDGVVASAKVDAGDGYSVITSRLTTGQTTAWLAWETDFRTTGPGEVSYVLHLAEITSGDAWDGGPAPSGSEALADGLQCVA